MVSADPGPAPPAAQLAQLVQAAWFDAARAGIVFVDGDGCCRYVNDRLPAMLGCSSEEVLGVPLARWICGGGREAALTALAGNATDGKALEVELQRKDGNCLWVALELSPVFEPDGQFAGTLAAGVDITARRRAAASLPAIAEASRALANQMDGPGVARVVAHALGGGVVVGLAHAALVGVAAPDEGAVTFRACSSVDPRIDAMLHPLLGREIPVARGSVAQEVLRTGKPLLLGPEAVDRLLPPLAEVVRQIGLSSVLGVPLAVYGRPIGFMCVFRWEPRGGFDATDVAMLSEIAERTAMAFERAYLFDEKRRAATRSQLLADAGALLATTLEVEPAAAGLARLMVPSLAHASGVVLFEGSTVGARAVATSDPALEEAMRGAMKALDPGAPPGIGLVQSRRGTLEMDRPQLVRHVDDDTLRALAGDDARIEGLRAAHLDSLIRVPLLARDRLLGVITLGRTHGDPYDESDLAFAEDLGWRVALAIDNARLYKRALEALALRDEFLAIAGHELNTPLTPLKLQVDALRRGEFPPERVREKLDAASRQLARLTQLVTDLLEISRFTEGQIRLVQESFDLAALVDTVVERMADEARRAGSRVQLTAQRPCTGVWDKARIDQVLMNLLSNALKYGAGHAVDVEVSCSNEFARLVVRDRGIGIARENQVKIFGRFERASSPRHYGGFGLGLWLVRQIVDAVGGSITVESELQRGATFVVDLPRNLPSSGA